MRALVLLISFCTFLFSENYVFLLDKYDKEVELEAKIIAKIASVSLVKKKISLYIPKVNKLEKRIYSKYFTLTNKCESADFIFDKGKEVNQECIEKNKLYFTNNYRKLMSNKKYFGAFFWNKSRPNIVFVKDRLSSNNINLPNKYDRFIEDFDE